MISDKYICDYLLVLVCFLSAIICLPHCSKNSRGDHLCAKEKVRKIFYSGLKKIGVVFVSVVITVSSFQDTLAARTIIEHATAMFKITKPNGRTLIVGENETLGLFFQVQ